MARPFDHHLAAVTPGPFGEQTESFQFGELGSVARIRKPPGSQAVSNREGHIVLAHHSADLIPELIHQVLLAVVEHPLREQRAASAHDANQTLFDEGQMFAQQRLREW